MLKVEQLERRDVPSAVSLTNGQLVVALDNQTNLVSIDSVDNTIQVTINEQVNIFESDEVSSLVVNGGNKQDVIQNNTGLDFVAFGNNGNDTIFGGLGNNTISGGNGKDVVYALLGNNTIDVGKGGADRVFTNFGANVVSDKGDLLVRFFAPHRTPGSGFIGVEDGILYITPQNNGSVVVINQQGESLVVDHDLDGDGQFTTSVFQNVKAISYFGGGGDDVYINNSSLQEAAYGSAGDDMLMGGTGKFSLLKGSGGDDVLVGRAAQNDLSGNSGADILIALGRQNIIRQDAADIVFAGGKSLFISP